MELVYLWVEDYKNIHKQEFNFSPRFEFEYVEEKNELALKKENKEYVNIFPENINVTAIVGENGSGKSSVLEFIRLALKKDKNVSSYKSLIVFFEPKTKKTTLLNLLKKEIICSSCSENILYKNIEDFNKSLHKTIFPTFDYSLTYNLSDYTLKSETIKRHFPISPKKFPKIDLLEEEREHIKQLLINYHTMKVNNNFKVFENFFQISRIRIHMKLSEFDINDLCEDKKLEANSLILQIKDEFEANQHKQAIDNLNKLIRIFSQPANYNQPSIDHLPMTGSLFILKFDDFEINLGQLIDKNHFKTYQKDVFDSEFNAQCVFEWKIEEIQRHEIDLIVDSFKQPYFSIEIIDANQKKFNDLSFGEQQLLKFLNELYYIGSKEYVELITQIENNIEDIDGKIRDEIEDEKPITLSIQNFVIFLDEIEFGLHPIWQAQTINYMINFLKHIKNRNFYLILATHSPFILSDLSKENVTFLEGGKQVYPNIETFGANIHTLLSHGFFMKDGLMGEFAKEKINEAINYLNQKQLSEGELEYCENIISIIGEPILKKQLQKMLDSKRLSKIDEIEKIKDEIKRLEERMTLIWKNSNDSNSTK